MGLFKKEPDMLCWNCDKLISHKKIKWHLRKVGAPDGNAIVTEQLREIEKSLGNKKAIATPNLVFGFQEYEHRGQCPECNVELTGFWFGFESLSKNKNAVIRPRPFLCNKCENTIKREFQFWYSSKVIEEEKIKEYLLTVCPKCNTEQGYPFEYDLERGIIE